jgi:hypothetical protein
MLIDGEGVHAGGGLDRTTAIGLPLVDGVQRPPGGGIGQVTRLARFILPAQRGQTSAVGAHVEHIDAAGTRSATVRSHVGDQA